MRISDWSSDVCSSDLFLQQGKIDLLIATMSDTEERRKVVMAVDPNYYSSGTNILASKKYGFKKWEDLKGKPVCGIQGAFYNRKRSEAHTSELQSLMRISYAVFCLNTTKNTHHHSLLN